MRLASLLPGFEVVMSMQGAGEITGPQLMTEIGNVRRFTHKGALIAFAGVDAPPFQSGTFDFRFQVPPRFQAGLPSFAQDAASNQKRLAPTL